MSNKEGGAVLFVIIAIFVLAGFISALGDSGKTGEKTDFQYCWELREKRECFEQLKQLKVHD